MHNRGPLEGLAMEKLTAVIKRQIFHWYFNTLRTGEADLCF